MMPGMTGEAGPRKAASTARLTAPSVGRMRTGPKTGLESAPGVGPRMVPMTGRWTAQKEWRRR
jgi:hypothetical protein